MLRRIAAVVLVVALAAVLVVIGWPQAFGLQRTAFVTQVTALRGAAVVGTLLVALVLTAVGLIAQPVRRLFGVLAVVLLAFALGSTVLLLTRGVGAPTVPTAGANDITVLSWNTLGDSVSAERVAQVARQYDADVVALPETSRETAERAAALLDDAGRPTSALVVAYSDYVKAQSTALLVSDDLGRYRVDEDARNTPLLPSVVAVPSGGQNAPKLLAVHPVAPVPERLADWREGLERLAAECRGGNVVLAGDLNATLDHMAGLETSDGAHLGDCRDAALATRNAAVGTWPTMLPALVGTPIDHVMATPNWRVAGFRVIDDQDTAGSDHRPVLARLSPAG